MAKELKYLFFIIIIFFSFFFTLRHYFSDANVKQNFRSLVLLDKKISRIEKDLILLKNNTDDIIEYVELDKDKKIKKYSFWKLLYNDWFKP